MSRRWSTRTTAFGATATPPRSSTTTSGWPAGRCSAPGAQASRGSWTALRRGAMSRFARAARIYDVRDEVHRAWVARQVLRGYEAPAGGVPSEHVPTRREAARRQFAELLDAVTAND